MKTPNLFVQIWKCTFRPVQTFSCPMVLLWRFGRWRCSWPGLTGYFYVCYCWLRDSLQPHSNHCNMYNTRINQLSLRETGWSHGGPMSSTVTPQNVDSVEHNIGAAVSAIVTDVSDKMFLYLRRINWLQRVPEKLGVIKRGVNRKLYSLKSETKDLNKWN
jgi:hypothetical protein